MAAAAPRRIEIVPWGQPKSTVGGFTRGQANTYFGGGSSYGSGAQNDEVTWDVLLDSGTWQLTHIDQKLFNRGIVTYYLDATSLGTQDWYNATQVAPFVATITGITVATAGWYTLKLKVESKNASSSAYYWSAVYLVLQRTGA